MTSEQIATLNSLVTYAAENVPGGLSDDEREVAQMVGRWALYGSTKTHNYKIINASHHRNTEDAANWWSQQGWRVVGAMGSRGSGYADQLILERPVGVTHPND